MDDFVEQWPYTSMTQPMEPGIDGLNALSALSAQFETLSRKLDALVAESTQGIAVTCDYCADNHPSHQCTVSFGPVHYGGDYLNCYAYPDYHQDLGYHPDSTWSYNYEDQYYAPSPTYAPEFSCPPPLPQEEKMSNFEELVSKIMASNEEMLKSQEMSIRSLENQVEQMQNVINNRHHGESSCGMVPEIDGVPELIVEDVPIVVDTNEEMRIKDLEMEDGDDPSLSSNANESSLIVSNVSSSPKLKNPGGFAISSPIGSHFLGEALCDDGASMNVEPWWDEIGVHEKKAENSIVFEELQFNTSSTDTMEQSPSFVQCINKNVSKSYKLGELDIMTPTEAKPSNVTWLSMDGGFLKFRRGIG